MADIFVFSNSYVTKTILLSLDYLFAFKVGRVILLKENHSHDVFSNNLKVDLYNTIEECVANCDTIIIVEDEHIPDRSIDLITSISSSKKVIRINNSIGSLYENKKQSASVNSIIQFPYDKHPVILCLSLSPISQQIYIELLLNHLFNDENIAFCQVFSRETETFLQELKLTGQLNKQLEHTLSQSTINAGDIILYSLNIRNISFINEYLEYIRYLKPDYTMVLVDAKFDKYLFAKRVIEYGVFSSLDITIKSHYALYDKRNVFYCEDICAYNDEFVDIETNSLGPILMDNIATKLAFPHSFIRY